MDKNRQERERDQQVALMNCRLKVEATNIGVLHAEGWGCIEATHHSNKYNNCNNNLINS